MEIVWSALTCFLTILIFVVPFLGLLLCLCFGFIANYRKKIASYLTTSIWLFWGQVLFYFVIYFHIIYISNKPSTLFILDIHPFTANYFVFFKLVFASIYFGNITGVIIAFYKKIHYTNVFEKQYVRINLSNNRLSYCCLSGIKRFCI